MLPNESSKIIPESERLTWDLFHLYPHLCSSLPFIIFSPFMRNNFYGHYIVSTFIWILNLVCSHIPGLYSLSTFSVAHIFHIITIWLFHILFISLSPPSPECELLHGGELVSINICIHRAWVYSPCTFPWNEWVWPCFFIDLWWISM